MAKLKIRLRQLSDINHSHNPIFDSTTIPMSPIIKPYGKSQRRDKRRLAIGRITFLILIAFNTLCEAQKLDENDRSSSIQLSLETLFHPLKKTKFVDENPITHWLDDQPSRLLIQRKSEWQEVELTTGVETPFDLPNNLVQQLISLEGVTESLAKSAVTPAITKLKKRGDTLVVPILQGLAVISENTQARWITKDATQWQDVSIDSSGATLAYTKEHDLYVMDLRSGKHLRLTQDGSETTLNGRLDWTYQEEIFGRGNFKGYWLHPNGQWLAMLKINTELVPEYSLGSTTSDRGGGQVSRYPKAGDPIPHASLLIWDLRKLSTGRVPRPSVLSRSHPEQELLVTGVWWHEHDDCLIHAVSDRCQTWREIHCTNPHLSRRDTSYHRIAYREESEAWIEPPTKPHFLRNGEMMWMSEVPSGYSQIYKIPLSDQRPQNDKELPQRLTPENVNVRSFWINPDETQLLFTADHQTGTVEQYVYQMDLSSTANLQQMTPNRGWSDPSISPDWKWLLLDHSDAITPSKLTLSSLSIDSFEPIQLNQLKIKQTLHPVEFLSIPTPDQLQLPAAIIRPESGPTEKVPVIVEVYGGPGSATVTNRWRGSRTLYRELLARQGIATVLVDNRSSAGRGMKDAWQIKGRVGEIEIQDLRVAVQWLKEQDWVDPERLLIKGWSFGGFMTISALTNTKDFKAGIAGGSVTDWSEYDAFYTERYMGLPQENPKGYLETSPLQNANKLHGSLLMIHGEADDNVHPAGTMRMARALQKAGLPFDLMIYPDEAHAIRQADNVWHLSKLTDQFIKDQLQPTNP